MGKFVDSKIVSYHLERWFDADFVQFCALYSKKDILKAKMYLKGRKIEGYQNFLQNENQMFANCY